EIKAQELVERVLEQLQPFEPAFTVGERVEVLEKQEDGSYIVITNEKAAVHCQAVVIAAGWGCFEPRKAEIQNLEKFEGKGVSYMIKNPEMYRGEKVVLAGGGDSALD